MQKKPLNLLFIVIIILFPKQSLTIESLAKTALVIDLSTNEVLLEKNSKAKTYPSSMTKMMTALVAFEKIKNGTHVHQSLFKLKICFLIIDKLMYRNQSFLWKHFFDKK